MKNYRKRGRGYERKGRPHLEFFIFICVCVKILDPSAIIADKIKSEIIWRIYITKYQINTFRAYLMFIQRNYIFFQLAFPYRYTIKQFKHIMEELKHSKYVGRLILNHATFDLYECCFTMKHNYETDSRNQNAKF